jgi:BolA protein
MTVADNITSKLQFALNPEVLEVVDDSDRHEGHIGHRHAGETHFNVMVVSAAFEGLTRVERQRRVHEILTEELEGPVHALSCRLMTESEVRNQGSGIR